MKIWQLRKWLEQIGYDLEDDVEVSGSTIRVSVIYNYNEKENKFKRLEREGEV